MKSIIKRETTFENNSDGVEKLLIIVYIYISLLRSSLSHYYYYYYYIAVLAYAYPANGTCVVCILIALSESTRIIDIVRI